VKRSKYKVEICLASHITSLPKAQLLSETETSAVVCLQKCCLIWWWTKLFVWERKGI